MALVDNAHPLRRDHTRWPRGLTVADLPALAAKKAKLLKQGGSVTVAEAAGMVLAAADAFIDAGPPQHAALLPVPRKLTDRLRTIIVVPSLRLLNAP
jgi:hypothetical protein